MENVNDLVNLMLSGQDLSTANRALRLRVSFPDGISDRVLLPQRVIGSEAICEGLTYQILCVAPSAALPLKSFIGLAAELQFVTDKSELHGVCGIITQACAGQSDGGLATYQLVLRDAMSGVLDLGANTRVFIDKNELDIIAVILGEWRQRSPLLAVAFEFKFSIELQEHAFPARAFTHQYNESDTAFVRRLLRRRGIAWHIRPGRAMSGADDDHDAPVHTLVMFDEQRRLKENAAGTVRYHRADATEERDTVTAWGAVRTLGPGSFTSFSWDYGDPLSQQFMSASARSRMDQGGRGNRLAAEIDDYRIETPHVGDSNADHGELSRARMARCDYAAKYFHGESTVRDLRIGEWITLDGHAEIDTHDDDARQFIITSFQLEARNNLPKALDGRVGRLFARNGWPTPQAASAVADDGDGQPFRLNFTCSRRGIRIVPAFDARVDVPRARMHSAVVVGPGGEEVHCDALGRVKVRFPGTRAPDHAHASGAGASDTDADSAWVRVATVWAGNGPGSFSQFGASFLPRPKDEVLIAYIDDDPDRPIIVGQLYNRPAPPVALSARGALPGNRYLAGLRSREVRGARGNQLRLDDTPGQISAQLASDHAASQLNLGWLTAPRAAGTGAPRGEGAELRSDHAVAVRGGRGVLITAQASPGDDGAQLDRDELNGLFDALSKLGEQLSKLASTHAQDDANGPELAQLIERLAQLDGGSNVAKDAGGAPLVAVGGPAGVVVGSGRNVVLGAETNIDTLSAGDT
ncbi:MAG TPA: type VI secretion system Vgr family protein, partial [Telluria sp.]|nr:type VI secretion system Vgr family protein [Telluria sp.]